MSHSGELWGRRLYDAFWRESVMSKVMKGRRARMTVGWFLTGCQGVHVNVPRRKDIVVAIPRPKLEATDATDEI